MGLNDFIIKNLLDSKLKEYPVDYVKEQLKDLNDDTLIEKVNEIIQESYNELLNITSNVEDIYINFKKKLIKLNLTNEQYSLANDAMRHCLSLKATEIQG